MRDIAYRHQPTTAGDRRVRAAAEALCGAVERRMERLLQLVEQEIELVRDGKLFALRKLEAEKTEAARDFISGLEAVKKIRGALEAKAPDVIAQLRRRHGEFKAMLQLNLAALETAKEVSNSMLRDIAGGRGLSANAMMEPEMEPGHYDEGRRVGEFA